MNDQKQPSNAPKKLSIQQAFFSILLSIGLISGTCFFVLMYYQQMREKQKQDPAYNIIAIVQTSPEKEGLKTSYLTELLELSIDHPRNLYAFDIHEAVEKLHRLPVIKEATVKKIRPGTIHVDYVLRKPIAYVGDYTNTAIDATGTLFPFKPFYTPKKLPEIYLGEEGNDLLSLWGRELNGKRKELAFTLLALAPDYCDELSSLSLIDVSHAFALSDGQRQMVIVIEDRLVRVVDGQTILCFYPRIIRLREDNYKQQLGNYLILRSYLRERDRISPLVEKNTIQQKKAVVIDLRLSELAFFSVEP